MIGTVVAKFQLERFSPERQTAELVPEANAEHGDASDEFANIFDGVLDRLWIARAIGKKDAIGAHAENFLRAGLCGHHTNLAMMIHEQSQNILLDAEIVGDNAKIARFAAAPGFAHLLGPRRSREINRPGVPHVSLSAAHAAG